MSYTLEGRLNFWANQPGGGERKLKKLMESQPEPDEAILNNLGEVRGSLTEARRYLLPVYDPEYDDEDVPALPLDFASDFLLNTAFTETFEDCDFHQGLKGLEYIQGMERVRQQGLRKAAKALGLTAYNFHHVLKSSTLIRCWVEAIDQMSPECDKYFSLCYMDLRVWYIFTFIRSYNEISWKGEAVALINTLFPPDLRVQPNPRISKGMMDHFRRQMYNLLLASLQDSDLIRRVIHGVNNPDPENPSATSFRSWTEARNCLLAYIQLSRRMILESENVIEEAKTAGGAVPTALAAPGDIPERPTLETTMAIANFLGLGEDVTVSKRHIAALAEFSRKMDAQTQKSKELEKRLEDTEQAIASLKRSPSVRYRNGNPVTIRNRMQVNTRSPFITGEDVEGVFGAPLIAPRGLRLMTSPMGSPDIGIDTPTGRHGFVKNRGHVPQGPPGIALGTPSTSSTPLGGTLATPAQSTSSMTPQLSVGENRFVVGSSTIGPGRTSINVDAGAMASSQNLAIQNDGTPQAHSPLTEPPSQFNRENSFSRSRDPREKYSAQYQPGNSTTRDVYGDHDTPTSIISPLSRMSRPRVTSATFLPSDIDLPDRAPTPTPADYCSRGETDAEIGAPTQTLTSRAIKKLGLGKKKKSVEPNAVNQTGLRLGLAGLNSSSVSVPAATSQTSKDKVSDNQKATLNDSPLLTQATSPIVHSSDSDSVKNKNAPKSSMNHDPPSNKSIFNTIIFKKKSTPRFRSRFSGRILEPSELSPEARALFESSRQRLQDTIESTSRLSTDAGESRPSTDTRHRSSIDSRFDRPESRAGRASSDTARIRRPETPTGCPSNFQSQDPRQPNVLRKSRSQASVKTQHSTGAASPHTPGTPKTPKHGKKSPWGSVRSSTSQDTEIFIGDDHEPLPPPPKAPRGFQFPSALENETADQTSAIETLRVEMVSDAFAWQGLNRDGTSRYDDGGSGLIDPQPKNQVEDEKSPIKALLSTLATSYSPRKPELTTWHLNVPQIAYSTAVVSRPTSSGTDGRNQSSVDGFASDYCGNGGNGGEYRLYAQPDSKDNNFAASRQ